MSGLTEARKRERTRAVSLTRRGSVFLGASIALFLVAYSLGSREFQLGAALLAVMLLAAVIFVRVRRLRLTALRSFAPSMVSAGSTSKVTLDIRNLAPVRTAVARWRDRLPWAPWNTDGGDLRSLAPAGIRFAQRGNTTSVSYIVRPPRRGIFTIGPMLVSFGDPFGLVTGESAIAGAQRLIVTPGLVDLHDVGVGFAAGDGTARLIQRSSAGNEDDLMTREYRRGDALRRVHWRASARHGELMVRQEEQRSKPEVRLVVDTRRSGYSDAVEIDYGSQDAESETFEWVVRMVASLGVHLHRVGYSIHVVETAHEQISGFGAAGEWVVQDEAFLTSLASIQLVDAKRDRVGPAEQAAQGALFAVVAEPDAACLEWLLRQRRPGERAIAFVPVWSVKTREALGDAGWECVVFHPSDDLATVWSSVSAMAGRS